MVTHKPSLKTRALGYLARREHSRLELERKLAPHAKTSEDLSLVLDTLEQRGFLSAPRMVEQVNLRTIGDSKTKSVKNIDNALAY